MADRAFASAFLVVLAIAFAGCGGTPARQVTGSSGTPSGTPSGRPVGAPPVRLATKNFTEQFVLGELYAQALRARGIPVELKENVGSSELVDQALRAGAIDMYPEYIGVIVQELAGATGRPRTAEETYRRAKAFEARRGFALLDPAPGADADANVVLPALARRHRLHSTADLRKLGRFRYGGPPENRTRFQGAIGLERVYGLHGLRYVSLPISERYTALHSGRIDVAVGFTTEGRVATGRYVLLTDPKRLFGFQNIVPVVSRRVLRREGPLLARTLNAVSAKLTNQALREMNAAVELRHQPPVDVARRFLRANGLL